jgi:hypothetical protein
MCRRRQLRFVSFPKFKHFKKQKMQFPKLNIVSNSPKDPYPKYSQNESFSATESPPAVFEDPFDKKKEAPIVPDKENSLNKTFMLFHSSPTAKEESSERVPYPKYPQTESYSTTESPPTVYQDPFEKYGNPQLPSSKLREGLSFLLY